MEFVGLVGKISALERTVDHLLSTGIDTNSPIWKTLDDQLDSLMV